MRRLVIWDVPVRLVHGCFIVLIPALWWTANVGMVDLHKKIGLIMLALIVFRLGWGLVGSSTARFATFVHGPKAIRAYIQTLRRTDSATPAVAVVGHNPLGGLSVIALLAILAGQVSLGLVAQDTDGVASGPLNHLVSWDVAVAAGKLHGALFYALLSFIALHVLAILYYRIVKGDDLVTAMVTGRRAFDTATRAPVIAPVWRAAFVAALAVALAVWIAWGLPPWAARFPWDQPPTAEGVDDQSYM